MHRGLRCTPVPSKISPANLRFQNQYHPVILQFIHARPAVVWTHGRLPCKLLPRNAVCLGQWWVMMALMARWSLISVTSDAARIVIAQRGQTLSSSHASACCTPRRSSATIRGVFNVYSRRLICPHARALHSRRTYIEAHALFWNGKTRHIRTASKFPHSTERWRSLRLLAPFGSLQVVSSSLWFVFSN